MDRRRSRLPLAVCLVAGISLAVRLGVALSADILQDEALYWWTSREALGFCPHPPLVPLGVRLGTAALGRTVLAVRLGGLVWGTAGVFAAWLLGRDFYGRRAGLWAAALWAACPIYAGFGALCTPDSPLVFFWLMFIWAAWRGARTGRVRWWLLAGLLLAAGLYSKYMMVLALPSLAVALWGSRRGRAQLTRAGPWVAGLAGLALFVPAFVAWENANGWAASRYHLLARHDWTSPGEESARYVLSHVLMVSPLLYVGCVWAAVRGARGWLRGQTRHAWVAAFTLVPVGFFMLPGLFTVRELMREHWAAFGYAPAIVALAGLAARRSGGRGARRLAASGIALGAVAVVLVGLTTAWPGLAIRVGVNPPMQRAIGWRELGQALERELDARPDARFVAADSWSTALCAAFRTRRDVPFYALHSDRNEKYGLVSLLRDWQIDTRALLRRHVGGSGLLVDDVGRREGPRDAHGPPVAQYLFGAMEKLQTRSIMLAGEPARTFAIYACYNVQPPWAFRGWPARQGGDDDQTR